MTHVSRTSTGMVHGRYYILDPDTMLTRAMLDSVLSGPPHHELAAVAERRCGYCNGDGGFGVVYPDDLDEYDRVSSPIRDGFVQVYGFFGPPEGYEHEIPETDYLEFLAAFLRSHALEDDARRVDLVRASLPG